MPVPRNIRALGLIATGIGPLLIAFSIPDLFRAIQTGQESVTTGLLVMALAATCIFCFVILLRSKPRGRSNDVLDGKLPTVQAAPMFIPSIESELLAELQTLGGHKPVACTYLGGSGLPLKEATEVLFVRLSDSLVIVRSGTAERHVIPFNRLSSIEISGPGTQKTDAGVSGGGFGVEGFLQGVVVAATINALTSKSSTNTFLRILGGDVEIYLHSATIEPTQLKMLVSPAVVAIEGAKMRLGVVQASSITDEIGKLGVMLKEGILTEEEFSEAKRKLIQKLGVSNGA